MYVQITIIVYVKKFFFQIQSILVDHPVYEDKRWKCRRLLRSAQRRPRQQKISGL